MSKNFLKATALMIGTTFGAGIYSLPYVFGQVGYPIGLIYLLTLGLIVLSLNLLYARIVLHTKKDCQMSGFGEIYLGPLGKLLGGASLFIGIYGALLAYMIKAGGFISLFTGMNQPFLFSLIFYVFVCIFIFYGLKIISKLDIFFVALILIFIFSLAVIGFPKITFTNYLITTDYPITNLFLPYGVILFSLIATSSIPAMEKLLRGEEKKMERAVILGTIIPVLIYALFTFTILGISGNNTTDDAISGLVNVLPSWAFRLSIGLGLLTLTTSFVSLCFAVKETWLIDFKATKSHAFYLAIFPPLVLYLLGIENFVRVLEVSGALTGGLTGILIVLISERAFSPVSRFHPSRILAYILFLIFFLGMFSPFLMK